MAGSFAYDRVASTGNVSKCIVHIVTEIVKSMTEIVESTTPERSA